MKQCIKPKITLNILMMGIYAYFNITYFTLTTEYSEYT
jgi:hypothetical protein